MLEHALSDIEEHRRALVKVIQPNDVGATGSHQAGFHLPKPAWQLFAPREPIKGENWSHPVQVTWSDGTVTQSELKWWGVRTRSEFHLTRFNRIHNFYARSAENVGALLVIVPVADDEWRAHIIGSDDGREQLEAALGFDLSLSPWAVYQSDAARPQPAPDVLGATDELVRRMARGMASFPNGRVMAELAAEIVAACAPVANGDELLMELLRTEFLLFKEVESAQHLDQVRAGFKNLEGFLSLAQTITQRRKARAGKSLELHFESMLRNQGISFETQPVVDGTRPDFIFPSSDAYRRDPNSCVVLGVKTSCKDRWRQVVQEAPKVKMKYLLTIQRGVSTAQLDEMTGASVQLVVPRELHVDYAAADRARLLDVESFMELLRASAGKQGPR